MSLNYRSHRDLCYSYKVIFLIPNLYRRPGGKCPHASYRNKGEWRRYINILDLKRKQNKYE